MDFWAQHKDFVLKILAGVGIFLVALLARSITYGDDLEKELRTNASLAAKIRSTEVAPMAQIQAVQQDKARLLKNAKDITAHVGWNLSDEEVLKQTLLRRILRCTRKYGSMNENDLNRVVEDFRSALREDLNGGFGQLRLNVRQQLVDEASEKDIKVAEGIGYADVNEVQSDELIQYLLELELVARVVRYAIDAAVDKIEEIRITGSQGTRGPLQPIPGANPDFLQEYEVKVTFSGSQKAALKVLDRLEQEAPCVTLRGLKATRLKRPENHLSVELTMLATAANPDKDFAAAPEKKP